MRTLFGRFLLVFTTLLFSITAYLGARLAESLLQWFFLVATAFLLLLFPLVHWRNRGGGSRGMFSMRLQQLSFFAMGFFSWLLVVALGRDFWLLVNWLGFGPMPPAGWPAFGVAFALMGISALWAGLGLRLREIHVPLALSSSIKIAQVSDLHVGPTVGRRYVERVVKKLNGWNPDITVLTGDIIDGAPEDLADALAPLAELEPKGKVFFVPGNHEYYWRFPEWQAMLARLGFTVLVNEGRMVRLRGVEVWVGGVPDTMRVGLPDEPNAQAAASGGEGASLRLLLSHRPDLAEAAEKSGFHLQLSGHTHGGQFFPWTLVARLFHQYFLGLMKHKKMWIYVSPGTGTWGPPARFGTTPEISGLIVGKSL